jgi:hypothetical protein
MSNAAELNTPFKISSDLKLLKADCVAFGKQVKAHSDALEKYSVRFAAQLAAQQVLEKAAARAQRKKLRDAQVESLGNDLAKFDRGMTKRNRPSGK